MKCTWFQKWSRGFTYWISIVMYIYHVATQIATNEALKNNWMWTMWFHEIVWTSIIHTSRGIISLSVQQQSILHPNDKRHTIFYIRNDKRHIIFWVFYKYRIKGWYSFSKQVMLILVSRGLRRCENLFFIYFYHFQIYATGTVYNICGFFSKMKFHTKCL